MSVLFKVGYGGTDIDRFVRTLKSVGVRQLADVRAVAVSRKAGSCLMRRTTGLP